MVLDVAWVLEVGTLRDVTTGRGRIDASVDVGVLATVKSRLHLGASSIVTCCRVVLPFGRSNCLRGSSLDSAECFPMRKNWVAGETGLPSHL